MEQIRDTVSSSLSSRLQSETELEYMISGSEQLASEISTNNFEFNGTISGSSTSTGYEKILGDGSDIKQIH